MFRTLRFYHSFFKFLSTPSARRATQDQIHHLWRGGHFYPRPPRGGRQLSTNLPSYQFMISIHALREEGDSYQQGLSRMWTNFYPRPPRGGRPAQSSVFESSQEQFLSTPSARRATSAFNGSNNHIRFLSTPSARRATASWTGARAGQTISIHALREEGDFVSTLFSARVHNFYPRPPRGGRPRPLTAVTTTYDFYPRPPRGGRRTSFRC